MRSRLQRLRPEAARGTRFGDRDSDRRRALFIDASFRVVDVLRALGEEKGCTPGQVALAWVARQPAITSPIIGPRTMEQLEDNLGAMEVVLTDDDRRRLDGAAPLGGALVPTTRRTYVRPCTVGEAEPA